MSSPLNQFQGTSGPVEDSLRAQAVAVQTCTITPAAATGSFCFPASWPQLFLKEANTIKSTPNCQMSQKRSAQEGGKEVSTKHRRREGETPTLDARAGDPAPYGIARSNTNARGARAGNPSPYGTARSNTKMPARAMAHKRLLPSTQLAN